MGFRSLSEAREDRIGGRIYTSRKHGKAARDLGPAWMHETSQNKLVQLISKLNIEYYYDDGIPLYYTRDGRAGFRLFKAKKVADEFADYCEWFYKEHPHAPDRTVKDFINEFVVKHPLITSAERIWAPQAMREVELWLGTSIEEASSTRLSYFATERNLYLSGGYDKIVGWTAAPLLKNNIIHRENKDASITVRSARGQHIRNHIADAVVVTVPLGVLRHSMIKFSPPLPISLQTGIQKHSDGALGKVFVEFTEVFWPEDNDQFVYYPSPLPEGQDDLPELFVMNHAAVTSNLWFMSGTIQLCIQIAEPLAQHVEAMQDPSIIYAFFQPLLKLFHTEPREDLPALVNIETSHWTQDPFAGFGSYSVEKKEDDARLFIEALEKNRGSILQFAGEHCTVSGSGCVHGAFHTGEVAARNLLATFGIAFDGKDTTTNSIA